MAPVWWRAHYVKHLIKSRPVTHPSTRISLINKYPHGLKSNRTFVPRRTGREFSPAIQVPFFLAILRIIDIARILLSFKDNLNLISFDDNSLGGSIRLRGLECPHFFSQQLRAIEEPGIDSRSSSLLISKPCHPRI